MALDDTRRAAIEAYLGVGAGYAMNDLEYLYWADLLANGVHVPVANLASDIHAATLKTTPALVDEVFITDSADSFAGKKTTIAGVQAAIKGSPSTLYVATDTYANIVANYPAAGLPARTQAWASDLRCAVRVNDAQTLWRPVPHVLEFGSSDMYLGFGGLTYTWSRAASGIITITAAAHGLLADYNGATVHLTQGVL